MDKAANPKSSSSKKWIIASIAIITGVGLFAMYWSLKENTRPARSQDPKPPFPYSSENITFPNHLENIRLAGTLTIPHGSNKAPAVILISGYGPQNRDAEWAAHKPFFVISDYLTRHGISVLRFDDRGFGHSTGDYYSSTSLDFSSDVDAAIQFLKTRHEIDSNQIGLIGHSDGAMVAGIVASRDHDIAFIVMLAGPGLKGSEVMISRQVLMDRKAGRPEEEVQRSKIQMERLIQIVIDSKNEGALKHELREFAREIKDQIPDTEIPNGMNKDEFVYKQMEMFSSPWFKFFFNYDPRTDLEKVICPVLAISGDKDVQAPSKENLTAIEQALRKGGNKDVIIKEFSGINHMFQECNTGMIDEYLTIEQTFSPQVLDEIGTFIIHKTVIETIP